MQNITSKEQDLLLIIAEYQPLSIEQISLLTHKGKREIQRKIKNLYEKNFINFKSRRPNGKKGRSENIIFLSEIGFKYGQERNIINDKISLDKFISTRYINTDHQLLLTWFRIHLESIHKKNEDLKSDFIASTIQFLHPRSNRLSEISESFTFGEVAVNFIPDGVFYLKSEQQNKSLLFFLEVDMGTESLASRSTKSNNISSKIKNYRTYSQTKKYKRYQKTWNTSFNGFRVLFLTNSSPRKNRISELVSSEKSNDFIWVAHQLDMFNKGLGGKIWARGGNLFTLQESILGPTLCFEERIIQ